DLYPWRIGTPPLTLYEAEGPTVERTVGQVREKLVPFGRRYLVGSVRGWQFDPLFGASSLFRTGSLRRNEQRRHPCGRGRAALVLVGHAPSARSHACRLGLLGDLALDEGASSPHDLRSNQRDYDDLDNGRCGLGGLRDRHLDAETCRCDDPRCRVACGSDWLSLCQQAVARQLAELATLPGPPASAHSRPGFQLGGSIAGGLPPQISRFSRCTVPSPICRRRSSYWLEGRRCSDRFRADTSSAPSFLRMNKMTTRLSRIVLYRGRDLD